MKVAHLADGQRISRGNAEQYRVQGVYDFRISVVRINGVCNLLTMATPSTLLVTLAR